MAGLGHSEEPWEMKLLPGEVVDDKQFSSKEKEIFNWSHKQWNYGSENELCKQMAEARRINQPALTTENERQWRKENEKAHLLWVVTAVTDST